MRTVSIGSWLALWSFVGVFLVCSLAGPAQASPMLCWTAQGAIQTANRSGGAVNTVYSPNAHQGVEHNPVTLEWFWFNWHTIYRANLDGSNLRAVVTDNSMYNTAGDFTVDSANGHVYWTNVNGDLRRVDLDGANQQLIMTGVVPGALEVDPVHAKLFFLQYSGNGTAIYMSNLNGSGSTYLTGISPIWKVTDLAVDIPASHIYWSETAMSSTERVRRLGLGPGMPTTIIDAELGYLNDVTLDPDLGKLLMVDYSGGRILESDKNGSNLTTLVSGLSLPRHVAYSPTPEPASIALLALGCLAVLRRRRRK